MLAAWGFVISSRWLRCQPRTSHSSQAPQPGSSPSWFASPHSLSALSTPEPFPHHFPYPHPEPNHLWKQTFTSPRSSAEFCPFQLHHSFPALTVPCGACYHSSYVPLLCPLVHPSPLPENLKSPTIFICCHYYQKAVAAHNRALISAHQSPLKGVSLQLSLVAHPLTSFTCVCYKTNPHMKPSGNEDELPCLNITGWADGELANAMEPNEMADSWSPKKLAI